MTDAELAEIEATWTAATPGPWESRDSYDGVLIGRVGARFPVVATLAATVHEANMKAIASAPEHIARLLAEVKRLRALAAAEKAEARFGASCFVATLEFERKHGRRPDQDEVEHIKRAAQAAQLVEPPAPSGEQP